MPMIPTTRDTIFATLKSQGPMSIAEIAETLGWGRNRVCVCMCNARAKYPGQFFRVVRYEYQRGKAGREIPIYAAKRGADAPRPVLDIENDRERKRRWYRNHTAKVLAAHRQRRAKKAGRSAAPNPWAQLIPAENRAAALRNHSL